MVNCLINVELIGLNANEHDLIKSKYEKTIHDKIIILKEIGSIHIRKFRDDLRNFFIFLLNKSFR